MFLKKVHSGVRAVRTLAQYRAMSSKVFATIEEAVADIPEGALISAGGFGVCGMPEKALEALHKKGTKKLGFVSNDAGTETLGIGALLTNNQVDKLYCSYIGENPNVAKLFNAGKLEVNLVPQGTLAEKMRAAGAGIPAFFTRAGLGTVVQKGGFPTAFNTDRTPKTVTQPKESRFYNGEEFILEESITCDFGLVKAWKGDKNGNLIFRATARNFNPECGKCAKVCIAEVEELVEVGELNPNDIQLPGIFVDRIVKCDNYSKHIAKRMTRVRGQEGKTNVKDPKREIIGRRAAKEFRDGMNVNLGIGLPTMSSNYIPEGVHVTLHSENGLLGMGPYPYEGEEDADLINAGKETVTYLPGSSVFSSSESFGMIRGRHIHLTILGALEVSSSGDLASWVIPGGVVKGMGGAMDLVSSIPRVIVTTTHCTKEGEPKILKECSLPLTGKGVVDMIITERAVFTITPEEGMVLTEIAKDYTVEDIVKCTGAPFKVASNLIVMDA